jgi:helicase MOV-10
VDESFSRFSVQVAGLNKHLVFGRETNILVKFAQNYRGRFEDRLEIVLEDTQLDRRFVIARQLRIIVGDKAAHALYKPVTPYVPQKRTSRQPENDVLSGVVSHLL